MTKPCKECKKMFRGSHQRQFCCPECAEIYVIKKRKEEREKAQRPWEVADDEWPTPLPSDEESR